MCGYCLLELAGELLILMVQFVGPGREVRGVEGVELLAQLVAQGVMEPIAFPAQLRDFLPGEFEFRA